MEPRAPHDGLVMSSLGTRLSMRAPPREIGRVQDSTTARRRTPSKNAPALLMLVWRLTKRLVRIKPSSGRGQRVPDPQWNFSTGSNP